MGVIQKIKDKITGASPKKDSAGKATTSLSADELVEKAYALLKEYRTAYTAEVKRLDDNEQMYRGGHWKTIPEKDANEPRPVTPSLHSAIESTLADIMDRLPQATILPEDPEDKEVAEIVNAIIRQNHDAANYRKEFSKLVHDLLVGGYCVQEVGYDIYANRGIGSAFIRRVDIRNIMFDPQAEDIQDGRGVITISPRTIDWLEQRYPEHKNGFSIDSTAETHDSILTYDPQKSVLLLNYWWREFDQTLNGGVGGYKVHLAQLAGQKLIADSRVAKPDGYFFDGEYPFVVTTMYERKGTPLGWGMVDMLGPSQLMADKLDQIVIKNAYLASHNKLLVTAASGFSADDLRDWSKEVHEGESVNGITWFTTPPLPQYLLEHIRTIRENMKETSGANDVSQGNVGSGVTSFAAISALKEASNKRSRMAAQKLHQDFKACVVKEIEAERAFNVVTRTVRLNENGTSQKAAFTANMLTKLSAAGVEMPVEFSVSVKVEQETPWSRQAQNELVLNMMDRGAIQPQDGLEAMQFDGKEAILAKMSNQEQAETSTQDIALGKSTEQQANLAQKLQQMQTPDAAIA